jgi:hypothetical protein
MSTNYGVLNISNRVGSAALGCNTDLSVSDPVIRVLLFTLPPFSEDALLEAGSLSDSLTGPGKTVITAKRTMDVRMISIHLSMN